MAMAISMVLQLRLQPSKHQRPAAAPFSSTPYHVLINNGSNHIIVALTPFSHTTIIRECA